MREAILAVDIGSSSCRAVLFDFKRKGIVTGRKDYSFQERRPGWMEQDPHSILRAFHESVRQVTSHPRTKKYHIRCLSLSSVLHSLLPVDGQGRPLAPLQTWGDNRARLEDFEWRFKPHSLYRRTGCVFHPSYPFCKILWMREHQTGLFNKAAKFISIKSFILATLFKRFVEDISVASATGLFNSRSMLWDTEALALTGLNEKRLPELISPYEAVGQLGSGRAKELGLPPGTLVIAGAGDGPLANLGGGSFSSGETNVTVGTSAAVRVTTKRPIFDPKRRLWCYRLDEDYFIFGGSSNNGAYMRQWAIDHFGFRGSALDTLDTMDELNRMDGKIMQRLNGSKGLLFYPFLRGERSPYWEPGLRGGLLGFTTGHDRYDFMRATMEGLACNLLTILKALHECVDLSGDLIGVGGGFRSRALGQILADVLNSRVRIPEDLEASARGACIMGLKAVGAIQSLSEAEEPPHAYREITPNRERARFYKKLYRIYERYLPFFRSLSLELDKLKI